MPAKAIMIQGTMSSAGKSLIAAGLSAPSSPSRARPTVWADL